MAPKVQVDVARLREELSNEVQPHQPRDQNEGVSIRTLVFDLAPTIIEKLNGGCSYDDIVLWFKDKNVSVTNQLLRSYIWQYSKKQALKEGTPPETSAVQPQTVKPISKPALPPASIPPMSAKPEKSVSQSGMVSQYSPRDL